MDRRLTSVAYQRVKSGQRMPGVVEVPTDLSLQFAINDIRLIATASEQHEWEGQIIYLPL